MFTALAEKHDYFDDKVALFVSLGSISMIPNNTIGLVDLAMMFYNEIYHLVEWLGYYEVMAYNPSNEQSDFCTSLPSICMMMTNFFYNREPTLDDPDRNYVSSAHGPNGASVYQGLHFAQNIRESRF